MKLWILEGDDNVKYKNTIYPFFMEKNEEIIFSFEKKRFFFHTRMRHVRYNKWLDEKVRQR